MSTPPHPNNGQSCIVMASKPKVNRGYSLATYYIKITYLQSCGLKTLSDLMASPPFSSSCLSSSQTSIWPLGFLRRGAGGGHSNATKDKGCKSVYYDADHEPPLTSL